MKYGAEAFAADDLSSLRLLGTVGEPINPEAWAWYWKDIGGGRCPVVDTWWQTETGMIMITPLPGITTLKPGSRDLPVPRREGRRRGRGRDIGAARARRLSRPRAPVAGHAARHLRRPGAIRADLLVALSRAATSPGDGCKRDEEGYYWLLGRVDDVMNVSGHRISTTEVESALVSHPAVAEAAVVGRSDPITGQAIFSYVILRSGNEAGDALAAELREHVAEVIGKFARPKQMHVHA